MPDADVREVLKDLVEWIEADVWDEWEARPGYRRVVFGPHNHELERAKEALADA
jgi:hypothetical protein